MSKIPKISKYISIPHLIYLEDPNHDYIHIYIYDITLHYITLHFISFHYITLHYITLHIYICIYICIYKRLPVSRQSHFFPHPAQAGDPRLGLHLRTFHFSAVQCILHPLPTGETRLRLPGPWRSPGFSGSPGEP